MWRHGGKAHEDRSVDGCRRAVWSSGRRMPRRRTRTGATARRGGAAARLARDHGRPAPQRRLPAGAGHGIG